MSQKILAFLWRLPAGTVLIQIEASPCRISLPTPRQTQNISSRCLNFNTEIKGRENEKEKENEENEQEIFEWNDESQKKEKMERHQMSPQ